VKSQPLGGARANAWQALELIDQSGQGAGEAAQGPGAGGGNLGVPHGCGEAGTVQGPPLQSGAGEFYPVGDGAPQIGAAQARPVKVHLSPLPMGGIQLIEIGLA
jgi:hypothetical protein